MNSQGAAISAREARLLAAARKGDRSAFASLVHEAAPGEPAELVTAAGRRLEGTLDRVLPAYEHGFGQPVPELLAVGEELRARLRGEAPER